MGGNEGGRKEAGIRRMGGTKGSEVGIVDG